MATLLVDDNNNGDFSTVAEAITAAEAGDTIVVTGGEDNIHNEANIIVNKEVTIQSDSNGATIDAEGAGRVFTVNDGDEATQLDVAIKDLTITGGEATDEVRGVFEGGGILNLESLTLENSEVTNNNSAQAGGGISVVSGELTIKDSVISNNDTVFNGGGIFTLLSTLTIENSNISNNSTNNPLGIVEGGGGIFNANSITQIEGTTFDGNTAIGDGGAIANSVIERRGDSSSLTVKDSTFINNSATLRGGAISNDGEGGTLRVQRSTFSNNAAEIGGGAIANQFDGTAIVEESTIENNNGGLFGGGVFSGFNINTSDPGASTTLIETEVENNTAFFGGGVFNIKDTLTLDESEIEDNTATVSGNDILEVSDSFINLTDTLETIQEPANLVGTPEDDLLVGLGFDDTLNGAGGNDIKIGGDGRDVFVIAPNTGTDTIVDFIDGEDFIGLSGGISFDDLTFTNDTITFNGESLAVLIDIQTNTLTNEDFVTV